MRALTIAAMIAAGLVSTIGISGSGSPVAHAAAHHAAAERPASH
jgi:hypothetical protein